MTEYATTTECRMAFLRRCLDDPGEACGRCDNCTGEPWAVDIDIVVAAEASRYLRQARLPITPRKRWPHGLTEPTGAIPAELRPGEGRALSVYGDGGWGRVVRRAKFGATAFPDELVKAAVSLVTSWAPDPAPAWVTCVPSSNNPALLAGFAGRLAAALGLPFHDVVRRVRPGAPQKEMENSAQQLRNVYRAFEVHDSIPATPVLLVDDIVDSGWTLTTIGVALREAGSGVVYPFALAKAVSR